MELLVALFLTAVMLLAMVQLVNAGASTARLQDEQAGLQDRLRFAAGSIFIAVSGAGFSPEPWNGAFDRTAIGADSGDNRDRSSMAFSSQTATTSRNSG